MKYTKKVLEDKRVQIDLALDAKEWEEAVQAAYEKNKGKYSVQGFRKGHTPRKVLEKTYGASLFYDEAIDGCFYRYYFEVLSKEKTIEPVAAPDIEIKSISEKGLELVLKITVKPEVELGEYKGLKVEKTAVKVTKEEVDKELKALLESQVKYVEVEREVKNGDTATIDFSGSIDGVKFDGGTATDFDLEIGSKSFIDTFEDQLVGLKKGDKKDVKVTFPKEYHEPSLAGKPAVFEVEIKEVKEKQYPELNDTFASEVSEHNTLKELTDATKAKIKDAKEKEAAAQAENKLIDMIVDNAKVDVPQAMVEQQVEDFIKDFEYRLSYQGLSLQGYLQYANITIEDLKKSRQEDAKKTVKTRLVLEQIITKEKIEVTDKDLEEKFNEHNKEKPKSIKDIKKTLNPEQLNYFENSILLNKLMKFLKDNNNM
ncbi:MAG: trigger factor [Clostridia bacterium]|nr:trigger factor [Clostridia bacterium]